jgi:sugar/nucleoside kinase (ribokinase family)
MAEIWTMGELLVEIMRPRADMPFERTNKFLGPFPSGAPAICIDTAARLGKKAGIIGGVGDDGFGKNLIKRLEADGVDCRYVTTIEGSTGVAFISYTSDGSREYIFHIKDTPSVKVKRPEELHVGNSGYFHLMGCSLFMDTKFTKEILETMKEFIEKGFQISFDPNIRSELLKGDEMANTITPVLEQCSVLLPGLDELLMLSRKRNIDDAIKYMFENYRKLSIIAIKLGGRGCRIVTRSDDFSVKAPRVKEVDPTGAGDCFDAGFLSVLCDGGDLIEAAITASAVGALNVQAFGPMEGKITKRTLSKMINTIKESMKMEEL